MERKPRQEKRRFPADDLLRMCGFRLKDRPGRPQEAIWMHVEDKTLHTQDDAISCVLREVGFMPADGGWLTPGGAKLTTDEAIMSIVIQMGRYKKIAAR